MIDFPVHFGEQKVYNCSQCSVSGSWAGSGGCVCFCTDPRIRFRIRIKMPRIRSTGCSGTAVFSDPMNDRWLCNCQSWVESVTRRITKSTQINVQRQWAVRRINWFMSLSKCSFTAYTFILLFGSFLCNRGTFKISSQVLSIRHNLFLILVYLSGSLGHE